MACKGNHRVATPGDDRWFGWHAHAEGKADALMDHHPLYRALGDTADRRCATYRALFGQALPEETLIAIRQTTNTARPLGGDRFKDELAAQTFRRVAPVPSGRPCMPDRNSADQGVSPL
jgi:putative transposase